MAPTPTIQYLAGNEQQIAQQDTLMVFSLIVFVIACAVVAKRWAQAAVRLKRLEWEIREREKRTV